MPTRGAFLARWVWQPHGQGRPLRNTMLVMTLVPLLLSLMALGLTITQAAKDTIEANEGEKLAAQARTVAEMIDTAIGQRLTDLQSRAGLLATLELHHRPQALSHWLDTIQQHIPEYTWIGVADMQGRIRAASQGLLIGDDVSQREWFVRGREQPTSVDIHEAVLLGSLLGEHPSGNPWRFIDLAAPVRSPTGQSLGVMGAHLSWEWLLTQHQRFLDSIPKHLHAEIIMLGEDGSIRLTGPQREPASLHHLQSFQQARQGQQGWLRERWPNGYDYLVGYTRNAGFGSDHQLGWITLIRLPLDAVDNQIRPVITGIWILVVAALLLFFAAMALLLVVTLRSTEHLVRDIDQIARHGGRLEVGRPAPREFKLLAQTTNQLIQSMEAQRAADQDKSRFIADMSHEIRTPLSGMIGLAELLRQRLPQGQDQQDINGLIRCGQELNQLLSDVIDFSAISENRLRLQPQPIRPAELIEHNVRLFHGLARQQGIGLHLQQHIPQSLCLMIDPLRLGQVIKNLISNAIKFTPQGRVDIRAQAHRPAAHDEQQEASLTIDVNDTGIGLTQAQQEIVFGRFQQAGLSIAERYGGSGLGLTLAKSLIDAMGGQLSLRSQIGRGTSISIQLPARPAPADAPITVPSTTPPVDEIVGRSLRILVVDDVAINREILCRWLIHHGHQPTEAASGEQTLEYCLHHRFDLILIDIDLVGMSGREASRQLRASAGPSANAVLIAVSGHAFAQDIADSLAAGIDLHINKPIDFDALLGLLHQIAAGQGLRRGRNTAAS